jgi:hypothetical protein
VNETIGRDVRRGLSTGVFLVLVVLSLLMGTAFAASNNLGASRAGDGTGPVSGYTVSNITWTMEPANPANMILVRFTLDRPATQVFARFNAAGAWRSCVVVAGTNALCVLLPTVPIASIGQLDVASAA